LIVAKSSSDFSTNLSPLLPLEKEKFCGSKEYQAV
jgi:hypothetical protein